MNLVTRLSDGELAVAALAIAFLAVCGLWVFVRWLLKGPTTPDPWDAQVAAALAGEESTPLCHRCLAPHDINTDFCTECGAAVGQYTNWLPFPYLFSLGHTLRLGTSGDFKHTPLTVAGFILLALAEYMLFAPIYWFFLFRGVNRRGERPWSPEPAPPGA